MAESPPPITITSLSLKNAPSQVAHVEIPRPLCIASFAAFNHIASAPVVIITDFVKCTSLPTLILKGLSEKSTESTFLSIISQPNRDAWDLSSSIISGPPIPLGYPGKFSISLVNIN